MISFVCLAFLACFAYKVVSKCMVSHLQVVYIIQKNFFKHEVGLGGSWVTKVEKFELISTGNNGKREVFAAFMIGLFGYLEFFTYLDR